MKAKNQYSQELKPYKKFKRVLVPIITILLFSCHSSERTIVKPTAEEILYEQYGRELYKEYQPNDYKKWQELNKLLEKDFISPNKLNVIDCRGLSQHSENLVKRKVLQYYILGKVYGWSEYDMKQGRCIQLNTSMSNSFFLNQFEASILLSASIGHNFKKLNLLFPKIIYKKTILNDLKGLFCGGTTIEQKENMTIYKGGCSETIHYEYETKKPPKNTSGIKFTLK